MKEKTCRFTCMGLEIVLRAPANRDDLLGDDGRWEKMAERCEQVVGDAINWYLNGSVLQGPPKVKVSEDPAP